MLPRLSLARPPPRPSSRHSSRPPGLCQLFIPNPCLDLVHDAIPPSMLPHYRRAYRTGDLVRWRPDSTIDFLGRIDRQVKISGVRIELGEVEAALGSAPGVEQAMAAAMEDDAGTKRLVGYVLPATAEPSDVIAHCRRLLVPAMVPSVVVALDAFPLLPNGKVDVKALPAPDWEAEEYAAPATELEATVQRVWQEVLGRPADEPLSVTADFFAAGGTSLQVFRVAAALQKQLGLAAVPTSLVHTERSARGVAAALSRMLEDGSHAGVDQPIAARAWPGAERPLSSNQEQMWLLSRSVGASAYNMPAAVTLSRSPDVAALQSALDAVAARHEVLRMRYQERPDGTVYGVVTPASSFHAPVEVAAVGNEQEEAAMLGAEAAAPFDLAAGPLVRCRLVLRQGRQAVVLALTLHHAVGDAWSMDLLQRELDAAYKAVLTGAQPGWAAMPIQYGDYAAWQQEQVAGEAGQELRRWWGDYLRGAPSLLQLPLDRPRPTQPSFAAGHLSAALPPSLMERVGTLARELHVNTQAVLLAALQAVLLRYSGQDEVVVGVPVAGRERPETQGLVGYFINTLPVRCAGDDSASFGDMARQASQATVDALAHSALPLEQVVSAAGVARMAGVNPLFQVLFQFLPEGEAASSSQLLGIPALPSSTAARLAHAKMDLTLTVTGGALSADYMADLFDEATIARLVGSFACVLQQAVTRHEARALGSALLPASERQQVSLLSCGPLRPEYLEGPLFHEAVARVAADSPAQRCLVFEGAEMSYGELDAAASGLAATLAGLGVRRGSTVGVMLERSFALVIAILGVLKAGGTYLPCDPAYPDDRLAIYLEDGGATVVLVDALQRERAQGLVSGRCPVLDVAAVRADAGTNGSLPACAEAEDAAYTIFTSGSTGRPKGCALPHRGLRDMLAWLVELLSLGPSDVAMFSNTIGFDAHVIQAFTPLTVGAALVVARPQGHLDAEYIVSLMLERQVTDMIVTVPSLAIEYLRALEAPYPKMRVWGMGGDSVPLEVVHRMQELFPNILGPHNVYGPTEVTAVTVQHVFPPAPHLVVIGRPDANVHAYVVDAQLRPVPVGVPGELLLSGPRLAIGYIGRPDLTAEKFIPNPCLDLVHDAIPPSMLPHYRRAYRTGDLVRWRPDSTIDFLGRIDRQVKISGVRIELGEVEAALGSAPGVEQAMAAAMEDDAGTKRLVGYVLPATAEPSDVIAHCRRLLVPAMVPSVVVALDAFPLLPNGKVDVKALPAPDWEAEEYAAPATELEATVQRVWQEVLGRPADEPLSVTADFFAAGGTSLQVFRVAAALQKQLGLAAVPTSLVHTERSARGVAAALSRMLEDGSHAGVDQPIAARAWPGAERPLSSNQEQMWLLSRSVGASAYNMPAAVTLSRSPDVAALQSALDAVAARHEVLRMRYQERPDGTVYGVVTPASSFHAPVEVAAVGNEQEEAAMLGAEAAAPFDLAAGPLVRCRLVLRQGRQAVVLALTLHHAVGDAWSMDLLQRELDAAYKAVLTGAQPGWAAMPIQYGDYAAWQQEQVAGEAGQELRRWWGDYLRGAPSLLQLPLDRPRPTQPSFAAGHLSAALPPSLMERVGTLARELHVNTQAVLLAALQAVLLRYSGQDEVVVGVPVAGRERPETQGLVGYFINTLPVRCAGDDSASFGDMARQASQATVDALAHSALPLEQVVSAAGVARMAGVNPLFQVLFQFLPEGEAASSSQLLGIPALPSSTAARLAHAKMDLTLTVTGGALSADYMADLFDEATIARLVGSFLRLLDRAAGSPSSPALASSLLGEADLQQVARFGCGALRPEYFDAPLVHEAFARNAAAHPDCRCLAHQAEALSYAEVERRSNQLARALVGMGVERDVPVAILLDRCLDLPVAALAVLKAGGCFVPLDPSFPAGRLAGYVEDAAARVVITSLSRLVQAQQLTQEHAAEVLCLDAFWEGEAGSLVSTNLGLSSNPGDLAYILFTSGSTGRPKGATIHHGGIRQTVATYVDLYDIVPTNVHLLNVTVSFDPHVLEVLCPLAAGALLVIPQQDDHLSPDAMAALISAWRVDTMMLVVPAVMQMWLACHEFCNAIACLEQVGLGGEPVPPALVNSLQDLMARRDGVINWYGPTETSVQSTTWRCPSPCTYMCIGYLDANVMGCIVDASLAPVPVGVPGELLVAGPKVGRGYVGRPDLTAEKFITNPCLDLAKLVIPPSMLPHYRRAYRTGDLVRWRPDGTIDFLGRIDRQVKISGVRIELGEVEAALGSAPGVEQAMAAAVEDDAGTKRLVGYVLPATAEPSDAIAHCRRLLVPAMVPSVVVALEAFPLLPNGKVDVKALPAPDWGSGAAAVEEYVAPASDLESAIQLVFQEVLDIREPVSVTADYFALGGSSLKAGILGAGVRKALGVNVPATLVMEHPTIQQYAAAVAELAAGGASREVLRSTTRQELGQSTRRLLLRSRSLLAQAAAALLSAESVNLAKQLPQAMQPTWLPFLAYLLLQALLGACAMAVVPGTYAALTLAALLLWRAAGVTVLVAACPLLYCAAQAWLAAVLVLVKRALFPRRMRPGLYPIYGWTFLRWNAYRALHRAVMAVLTRHIQRTRLMVALFRALGARIEDGVIMDSGSVYEPDLVTIGEGSVLAELSTVSAAFVAPAGFLDAEACLVFSTTRVGRSSMVGRFAYVLAGGRLPDGHGLRPYGSLNQANAVLSIREMDERYPHFYAEQHLPSPAFSDACAAIAALFAFLCALPGAVAATTALRLVTGLSPPDAAGVLLAALRGEAPQGPAVALMLALLLLAKVVLEGVATLATTTAIVAYKRGVMGHLGPGRDLLESDGVLLRYCVWKRVLASYNFFADQAARLLGARMHPSAGIVGPMSEHDAICIGAKTTKGGFVAFRCVSADGVIQGVSIGDGAFTGHTLYFGGASVGEGAQVGNEIAVAAGTTIPPCYQVQGDRMFRLPPDAAPASGSEQAQSEPPAMPAIALPGLMLALFVGELLFSWAPPVALAAAALGALPPGWHAARAVLVLAGWPVLFLLRAGLAITWGRLVSRQAGVDKVIRDGGSASLSHPVFLAAVHVCTSFYRAIDGWAGSPFYAAAHTLIGGRVHTSALLFSFQAIELELVHVDEGAVVDYDGKPVPHFIKHGIYFFQPARVEAGAWIGSGSRVLAPRRLEPCARVLPGSMVLPNEVLKSGSVWGGVPAQPVADGPKPPDRLASIARRRRLIMG